MGLEESGLKLKKQQHKKYAELLLKGWEEVSAVKQMWELGKTGSG